MDIKDEGTSSPNYGSLGVLRSTKRCSTSSSDEREGGDTFDSDPNAVASAPGRVPPRNRGGRPSISLAGSSGSGNAGSNTSRRSMFDSWLRRDFSVKGSILSVGASFRRLSIGGGSGPSNTTLLESFLGPTDHSVEDLIRAKGGLGLEYKSADRGIIDTAIWHRRKVALIKDRREEEQKCEGSLLRAGYEFDAAAVSRLESERGWMEWVLVVAIGIIMAIIGLLVSTTAEFILDWKLETALDWFDEADEGGGQSSYYWYYGLATHVGISATLAVFAFMPVALRPVSGGSGIAEAKAILNGVLIPNCTDLSTALCKAISVILSVAASLPAGLEGPMIFMGLSIGANINRFVPQDKPTFDMLRTGRRGIDFAAIGTAAGVAAAFRSPISGVLFSMEEGSSFWSTSLTWRCFLSACATVISMYAIMSRMGHGQAFHVNSMAIFNGITGSPSSNLAEGDVDDHPDFQLWEYVMFVLVGAGGGVIGAIFCSANRALSLLRRRLSFSTAQKGLEVFTIAAVTATLIWVLPSVPFISRCGDIESRRLGPSYFRQFNCPEGQYNELATLLLNPLGAKGITLLFTEGDPGAFSVWTCTVAGMTHLVILSVAFGMTVSAGIFIPLLFIGACLGRALALAWNTLPFVDADFYLDPRTYAIIGATATLGGVVRVLISLTAIVTHTTSLSFFMTPIMVAALLAQNVGNWVSGMPGIYDIILQLRGVPFLEEECPVAARHANIRARNVMRSGAVTVGMQVKVKDLVDTLQMHGYSDFPVVDKGDGGALVGSISRSDLLALLSQKKVFFSKTEGVGGGGGAGSLGCEMSSIEETTLSYSELDRARPSLPYPVGDDIGSDLTLNDEEKYIHLAPYMQIAPISIQGHGSAERAYELFRSLGLKLMVVVDKHSRPIGIITRHQLALLEEVGVHEHKVEKRKRQTLVYTNISQFKSQFE